MTPTPEAGQGRQTADWALRWQSSNQLGPVNLLWVAWFTLCFYPVSVLEFGVNYLFVATPAIYVLGGGRLRKLPNQLTVFAILLVIIFFASSLYQIDNHQYFIRRLVSFAIFMSVFSLAFIHMSEKQFNSVLVALILVCLILAFEALFKFFLSSEIFDVELLKNEVGSQRHGFILIFGFWVYCWFFYGRKALGVFGLIVFFTILAGILLTFSRSSIVSFLASILLLSVVQADRIRFSRIFNPLIVFSLASLGFVGLIIVQASFPQVFAFFNERLFEFFASGRVFEHLSNSETSEGTRIRIWGEILSYVAIHPFTGSGFLGIWSLGINAGSSHSQYFDVLFRLGVVGCSLYLALIWRVWVFLLRRSKFMFCGFGGVLVYGLFHETFKEPQGAALIAFLFSYLSVAFRQSRLTNSQSDPK